MAVLIRCKALPVPALLRELERFPFIAGVNARMNELGTGFRESWEIIACGLSELGADERAIIHSIGSSLGTSDISGQLAMLELNAALLKRRTEEAREQYLKKGKIYKTLGLLGGGLAAMLVL